MKNEIGKALNAESDWIPQTQKKLNDSMDAIQSNEQYIENSTEREEEVIVSVSVNEFC